MTFTKLVGISTKSIQWWDDNELGSVCLDVLTIDKKDNLNDTYDDDDIAAEIDLYFIAILKNMERQKDYLKVPTDTKLHIINEHEGFIMQAFNKLNVHSQRIITTFKSQIGYESCMDTLIKKYPLPEHDTTKPEGHSGIETNFNEQNLEHEQSTFISCDRDIHTEPPLEGELVLDLAGQARVERMDTEKTLLDSALELQTELETELATNFIAQNLEHENSTFISCDRDIHTEPPLEGELVLDLAGQARVERMDTEKTLLDSALELQTELKTELATNFNAQNLEHENSTFISRDRDDLTEPPLEGELVPDLAGQAGANGSILELNMQRVNCIIELVANELDSLPTKHSQLVEFIAVEFDLMHASEIANKHDKVAAIRTSGESCERKPSSFVGGATEIFHEPANAIVNEHATEIVIEIATEIFHEPANAIVNEHATEIVIEIAMEIANEHDKVAAIRTSGESCERKPSSFVGGATEIFHEPANEIVNEHATEIVIEIATEIANEHDKVAAIIATEIFHEPANAIVNEHATEIVIEIAMEIANEHDKVAAIRTSGESCEKEPSSFVGGATEIFHEQPNVIVNEHATELSTEIATNISYEQANAITNEPASDISNEHASKLVKEHTNEIVNMHANTMRELDIDITKSLLAHELELQLVTKLKNEIDTHFQHGLDFATVQALHEFDPTLQLRMIVGIEIEEHLQCATQNYITQSLLQSTLALPLRLKLVIAIDTHLQREFRIDTIKAILASDFASQLRLKLECRPLYLNPRDREICAARPLEGGSDPDLAGQASADSVGAHIANLVSDLTILLRTVIEVDLPHDDDVDVNLGDELNVNLAEESATLGNVIDIDIGHELELNLAKFDKEIDVGLGHELKLNLVEESAHLGNELNVALGKDDIAANPTREFEYLGSSIPETIDGRSTTNLVPPRFCPRDRDICAALPLESGSDSGLAGQASAGSVDLRHERLETMDHYTQCDDQFGLIPFEIIGLYTQTMNTIASNQPQLVINSCPKNDTTSNNENELRLHLGNEFALPPVFGSGFVER